MSSSTSVFDVELNDANSISVIRYFLDLAAKRGAFSLPEAARIMEALNYLQSNTPQDDSNITESEET